MVQNQPDWWPPFSRNRWPPLLRNRWYTLLRNTQFKLKLRLPERSAEWPVHRSLGKVGLPSSHSLGSSRVRKAKLKLKLKLKLRLPERSAEWPVHRSLGWVGSLKYYPSIGQHFHFLSCITRPSFV
jgi:hypothetical protein